MPATWSRDIQAVLFDLDGTLADTAPDLAFALDTLRAEHGLGPIDYARTRALASHGTRALLTMGFDLSPDDPRYEPLRLRFLELYEQHLSARTTLFPCMHEVLTALAERGLPWGIVTNKPAHLTQRVVAILGLAPAPACVVSGDTTANPKPHPEPMLLACRQIGRSAHTCLFVGDSDRDIEAGRRAGMHTLAALFGYLRADDDPSSWGADGVIKTPLEVLDWLAGTTP